MCSGRKHDDIPAVAERAKNAYVGLGRAGNRQADGFGASREQQPVVRRPVAVGEDDLSLTHVDACDIRVQPQLNAVLGIEACGPQRNPVLRGGASEIVLGQIWSIDRWRIIVA